VRARARLLLRLRCQLHRCLDLVHERLPVEDPVRSGLSDHLANNGEDAQDEEQQVRPRVHG
jgi:hypothetical protein